MNQENTRRLIVAALPLALASSAMAQSVTFVNGALTINTSTFNTDQQIEVNVGPVAGSVSLSGVLGATQTSFVGVTSISLTAGPAQDAIEFRLDAAVLPTISVSTGTGNSDVKFLYAPPSGAASVTSSVTVNGGSADDKVFFEVISNVDSFIATWNVTGGGGNNEATAAITSPEPTSLIGIAMTNTTGNGQDKFEVLVSSDAAAVDLATTVNSGSGTDNYLVTLDALGAGDVNLQAFGALGAGNDIVEITNVSRGGLAGFSGFIDGGLGGDTLKFTSEADGSMNLQLAGGSGADVIDWFAKGAVAGTPRLLGGIGNDYLKLFVDGPQIATPFIDGGAGFDIAFGFGTIVNCEQVNQ